MMKRHFDERYFNIFSDINIHSVFFLFFISLVSHMSRDTWGQFYKHSTSSFYKHRSLKRKKTVKMSIFFALLGSALLKSASRMLMKLTLGQCFFEIQQRYVDKKTIKYVCQNCFCHKGLKFIIRIKSESTYLSRYHAISFSDR